MYTDENGNEIKPPWIATAAFLGLVIIGFVLEFFHII